MGSYQRSLLAIMLAQFTRKRFAGGMAGVVRLASRNVTVQVSLSLSALLPLNQAFKCVTAAWWLPLCLLPCFVPQLSKRSGCKQNVHRHLCLQGVLTLSPHRRGPICADERLCTAVVRHEALCSCAGAVDGGSWSGCACAATAQQVGALPMHACSVFRICVYHLCVPAPLSCRSL